MANGLCSRCQSPLPEGRRDWYCQECRRVYATEWNRRHGVKPFKPASEERRCSHCRELLAEDRVNPLCRDCATEYARAYRARNRDRLREYERKRERDPEVRRAYYYTTHDTQLERASRRRALKRGTQVAAVSRAAVFDRDGGICHICKEPADRVTFQLDHIVPLSRGGPHTEDNVATSHPRCNMRKKALLMEELVA